MEQYALMIRTNRKIEILDFAPFLGGEQARHFNYACWNKSKDLSNDPVDLWQVVNTVLGDLHLLGLVDEEGLLHEPPSPINRLASALFREYGTLCGDVVVVKASRDDGEMDFLTSEDAETICSLIGMLANITPVSR